MKFNTKDKTLQIHNSLIYLMTIGATTLLPFISLPILTRTLSPHDYGVLALAMIYAMFMCSISNFGITTIYERNYFQHQDRRVELAKLFYSCLLYVLVIFFLLAFLTFMLREYISILLTGSAEYGALILISFAATFFHNTANYLFFINYKNEEKAIDYSKYKILQAVFHFSLSIYLVVYLHIGILGVVVSQLITALLLFIILFGMYVKERPISTDIKLLLETLIISYPLLPGLFVKIIATQSDKYLIGLITTVGGVGIYSIGKSISEIGFTVMTALENVFSPQVYKRMFSNDNDDNESIGNYLTPFLYISILIIFLIAIFPEELLHILLPKSYYDATPIITISSINIGFLFFAKISSLQLFYTKHTHITSALIIVNLFTSVALLYPFIHYYGVLGAAIGSLISGIISVTIKLFVSHYYYNIKYEYRKVFFIMATFSISTTTVVTFYLLGISYYISFFVKLFFLLFYLNLGRIYGIITLKAFEEIKSVILLIVYKKNEN
jgi:O-antigen/teichoic acid export membrane protein